MEIVIKHLKIKHSHSFVHHLKYFKDSIMLLLMQTLKNIYIFDSKLTMMQGYHKFARYRLFIAYLI